MLILIARVGDGRVLGQDRDALLTLEVHRVHDPIRELLVGTESPRLAEHGVDEGGLAVIDVGDDRHIADISARGHTELSEPGVGDTQGTARQPRSGAPTPPLAGVPRAEDQHRIPEIRARPCTGVGSQKP